MKFHYGLIKKGKLVGYGSKMSRRKGCIVCRIPNECFEKLQNNDLGYKEKKGKHFLQSTKESRQKKKENLLESYKRRMKDLVIEKQTIEALSEDTTEIDAKITLLKTEYKTEKKSVNVDKNDQGSYELEIIENTSKTIIGNVTEGGKKKMYHTMNMESYANIQFDKKRGDKMFFTESEAEEAGFEKAKVGPVKTKKEKPKTDEKPQEIEKKPEAEEKEEPLKVEEV